MFRQIFISHLKRTHNSLRYYYSKKVYYFYLKFPKDTENNGEIKKYIIDLESAIKFPEYSHFQKKNKN